MCQPHHFLSKFLIFRTFPAYPSYKLHSYKKKKSVISANSRTALQSFSCFRRLKTYLRIMKCQSRLSSLALIHIEHEFVNRVITKNIKKLLMCSSCLLKVWKSSNPFNFPSFSDIKSTIVFGKRLVVRNGKASAPPDDGLQKRLCTIHYIF